MQLQIGDPIRYRGLGTGRVVDQVEREFKGQKRMFAVVEFPHRDMKAQLPIGDPKTIHKLSTVLPPDKARKLLEGITDSTMELSRTWDQRKEIGEKMLIEPTPDKWVVLLSAYAYTRAQDVMSMSSSDQEMVRRAIELVASEISCAEDSDYVVVYEEVRTLYKDAYEQHLAVAIANGLHDKKKSVDDDEDR